MFLIKHIKSNVLTSSNNSFFMLLRSLAKLLYLSTLISVFRIVFQSFVRITALRKTVDLRQSDSNIGLVRGILNLTTVFREAVLSPTSFQLFSQGGWIFISLFIVFGKAFLILLKNKMWQAEAYEFIRAPTFDRRSSNSRRLSMTSEWSIFRMRIR